MKNLDKLALYLHYLSVFNGTENIWYHKRKIEIMCLEEQFMVPEKWYENYFKGELAGENLPWATGQAARGEV